MAALTESYTQLADEFLARQIWTQHTVRLWMKVLLEDKEKRSQSFYRISMANLQFALWIHEQPGKPLLIIPRVSSVFFEMRRAAIAGKRL